MTTTVGDRAPVAAAAPTARDRAVRWAVVLGPALLALALGIQRSVRLPLWRDEFATAMFAKLPIDDLLASLGHVDAVTGLYYLLAHATAPVLGYDLGLRVLSIIAVAASTAVVALLALRWWGPLAASAAGVAFAVNESTLTSAALARQYALAVLFVALAVLAVEIAAATGRRWAWVGYAVAASAAVALHVLALVGIGLTALLLLGRARGAGRSWAWWCGATAIPAVVAVALLAPGLSQRGQLAWLSAPSLRTVIGDLADTVGVSPDREVLFDGIALIVFAATAVVALIVAVRPPVTSRAMMPTPDPSPIARVRPVVFAVALTVAPWLVLAAASWLVTPILTARYISWSTLGAALVIAAAVHAARTTSRGLAIVAGTLAGVVLATSILVAIPRLWSLPPRGDDFPAAVGLLEGEAEVGDLLVLQQRYYEGGVAFGFAASADDAGQVDDVFRRQPTGGQPLLDVRRITNADPLRSTAQGGAVGVGETVWLVGLLEPADPALVTGMEPSLAACLTGAGPEPYERFGALYVYRIACEVEAGSE